MIYPHGVLVRLWAYLEPFDRGSRFEDPLSSALEAAGLGHVTGGGSQLRPNGEIEFAEIELGLANLDDALEIVRTVLEGAGAPAGSELVFVRDGVRHDERIGTTECLAIYLDGVGLPDEVYATSDLAEWVERLDAALAARGAAVLASWTGPEETAVYAFGPNAESMYEAAHETLATFPLCQNARVVVRQGNPELLPRTIRLPRWQ
ncbi:MAG: hypothetical protein AB7O52_07105 [Planctomycetota bacterium]